MLRHGTVQRKSKRLPSLFSMCKPRPAAPVACRQSCFIIILLQYHHLADWSRKQNFMVTSQCQCVLGLYDASLGRHCVLGLTLWTHTAVFGFLLFIYDRPFFSLVQAIFSPVTQWRILISFHFSTLSVICCFCLSQLGFIAMAARQRETRTPLTKTEYEIPFAAHNSKAANVPE